MVSSFISGFFLNNASWLLKTHSAICLLGVRCTAGSSMKGRVASNLFCAASSSTLASISACSASSLKLTSSISSEFAHRWQFLHATQRYGTSPPMLSTLLKSRSSFLQFILYISSSPWSQHLSSSSTKGPTSLSWLSLTQDSWTHQALASLLK